MADDAVGRSVPWWLSVQLLLRGVPTQVFGWFALGVGLLATQSITPFEPQVLIMPAVALGFIGYQWRQGWRWVRVLRCGKRASGRFLHMVSTNTTVNRSLLMVAYFSFTAGDEQDYTLTYRTTHPDWRWCHAMYAPDEVEIPDEALLYDPANPPYAMLLRETGESLSLTDTEVIGGSRTRAIGLLIVPTLAVFGNVLALVVRLLP